MKIFILILLAIIFPQPLLADQLKPFTSDGCSIFPDGTLQQQSLWLDCCTRHDLAYWQGGTYTEKQQADQNLQLCVAELGKPDIADIMLAGVKVGGSAYWPTSYRWGYGWPYLRAYKALSDTEKTLVKQELNKLTVILNTVIAELTTIDKQ